MIRKTQDSQPMLPVNLLVHDRRCLVVGGGQVALRKVRALLGAGATVTVVDPQAGAEIAELAAAGRLQLLSRPFRQRDVAGAFLVFAATNAPAVNRQVLAAARRQRALCCCIDAAWSEGDFMSPAVIRQDTVTVAISTGGASCRRSRVIKENLVRHLHLLGRAELLVVPGLQLPHAQQRHTVRRLLSEHWPVQEFLLLPTHGRWDLLAVVAAPDAVLRLVKLLVRPADAHAALPSRCGPAALTYVWRRCHDAVPGYTPAAIGKALAAGDNTHVGLILRDWLDAVAAATAAPPSPKAARALHTSLLRSVPAPAAAAGARHQ